MTLAKADETLSGDLTGVQGVIGPFDRLDIVFEPLSYRERSVGWVTTTLLVTKH